MRKVMPYVCWTIAALLIIGAIALVIFPVEGHRFAPIIWSVLGLIWCGVGFAWRELNEEWSKMK